MYSVVYKRGVLTVTNKDNIADKYIVIRRGNMEHFSCSKSFCINAPSSCFSMKRLRANALDLRTSKERKFQYSMFKDALKKRKYKKISVISLNVVSVEIFNGTLNKIVEFETTNEFVDFFNQSVLDSFCSQKGSKATRLNTFAAVYDDLLSVNHNYQDELRSLITYVFYFFSKKILDLVGDSDIVVVTGDLLKIIPRNSLLLSIIDGIGIKRVMDILIDENYIETYKMITGKNFNIQNLYRYYPVKIQGKYTGSVVLGNISINNKVKKFFTLVDEIETVDISQSDKCVLVPDQGVKIGMLKSGQNKIKYRGKLIIDARAVPVTYGPLPLDNKKINDWLSKL